MYINCWVIELAFPSSQRVMGPKIPTDPERLSVALRDLASDGLTCSFFFSSREKSAENTLLIIDVSKDRESLWLPWTQAGLGRAVLGERS